MSLRNGSVEKFPIFDETGTSVDSGSAYLGRDTAQELAKACGFTMAGLVALPHSEESRDANRFAGWINAGHAGSMRYLARQNENGNLVRARVATPFPWARSAIVCFASYHSDAPLSTETHDPRSEIGRASCRERVSPYV